MNDRLDTMWKQQREFMELLRRERSFPTFPVDLSSKAGQRIIKDISHDCMHELFEAIHLLKNSKQHRMTSVDDFDDDAFIEELSDALHYFIEVCIMSGITEEKLFSAYMKKGSINVNRIMSGY